MYKTEVTFSEELGEQVYSTVLKNGLEVHICKKPGFKRKIGMFGTKYGSITNDFLDITTNSRVKVPDGIAHFLEHKLFEQEGANALDLFSQIGVSANAYTTFDHTVYYFETMDKFNEGMELLIKLVKTPYFTDENVEKEKGIIEQEIKMYDDDPNFSVYFNTLKAIYNVNTVKIDIAGTVESISKITKNSLYTCYNTFYSPQNMFIVIVGDVEVEETIKLIEDNIKIYENNYSENKSKMRIEKYTEHENPEISQEKIEQKMDIYMPQLFIGYKLDPVKQEQILKNQIICDIISDMYFSKITPFYEQEYNKGVLNEPVGFDYEGTDTFAHLLISGTSTDTDTLKNDLIEYIDQIKSKEIDEELFELIKRKKIGNAVRASDNLNISYRRIIDSVINNTSIYTDIEILKNIQTDDIKEFFRFLDDNRRVFSIIKQK